jgi:uncharacterized phiE125 gp8 family phage protein
MATFQLITPPSTEPVTLSDAKKHLNITDAETYWDGLISSLITAARQTVENMTWRSLVNQQWKLFLDKNDFSCNYYPTTTISFTLPFVIQFSKCPVVSIDSVKYIDQNGTQQTLDPSNYETDIISEPARVKINALPPVKDVLNCLVISFTAGYSTVPIAISQAILLLIAEWFNNREQTLDSRISEIPHGVDILLNPYKLNFMYSN